MPLPLSYSWLKPWIDACGWLVSGTAVLIKLTSRAVLLPRYNGFVKSDNVILFKH